MYEKIISEILDKYPDLGKRRDTFFKALSLIKYPYHVVETGCIRDGTGWGVPILHGRQIAGDGVSTLIFAEFVSKINGFFWSVDILESSLLLASKLIKENLNSSMPYVSLWHMDSIDFLSSFTDTIDLLYLDSFDLEPGFVDEAQEHNLNEFKASENKLSNNCLILIDDYKQPLLGKAGKTLPYLKSLGYKVIMENYQILLSK